MDGGGGKPMQVTKALRTLCASMALIPVFAIAGTALAANYPLQLLHPRAAGTSPDAGGPTISSNHRIFWAYPGIEYNIRASVIGGAYPYTFALSNAPSGMTVNSTTGTIVWTNPTSNATPTLTVTDSEGTQASGTWTITVDSTRFIFLDAVNGREFDVTTPGTGTLSNPFKKIRDLYSGSTAAAKTINTHANKIAYFRQGTYYIDGHLEDPGTLSLGRMPVGDLVKPVAWLAYPGETPTIDGQCSAASPQIGARPCNMGAHIVFYGNGNNTYWDGLRIINVSHHGVRVPGYGNYTVFRRGTWTTQGPTERSVNAGMITFTAAGGLGSTMGSYTTIQDNMLSDIDGGMCIELYSVQRILIEDNVCHTVYSSNGFADDGGIFIKGGEMQRVTVRANTFYNMARRAIAGNMFYLRSAEILFNRVYNIYNVGSYTSSSSYAANAIVINQNSEAGPIYISRNTFLGKVVVEDTDSADGPFYFQNNVIVNDDPGNHLFYENVSDPSRIVLTNNLVGYPADNIVGQNGNLTPAYSSYLGSRGYQRGAVPPAPRNLRVQ